MGLGGLFVILYIGGVVAVCACTVFSTNNVVACRGVAPAQQERLLDPLLSML